MQRKSIDNFIYKEENLPMIKALMLHVKDDESLIAQRKTGEYKKFEEEDFYYHPVATLIKEIPRPSSFRR